MTATTVWNAAGLQTGMTEILVAFGLRTPQDEAKSNHPHQRKDDGAAGDLENGTHSQTLELHLGADSEAAADESDAHVPSEAEGDEATPGTGLQDTASRPLQEEEEGMAADADEDNADASSMISDGADSYQGLPPESLAHLTALANENAFYASEGTEQDAAAAKQNVALDTACELLTQNDEQQLPPDAHKPVAVAQTEADAKAEQASDMMPGEQLQLGDGVREAEDQSGLQMAVDELPEEMAGSSQSTAAAAQALPSSGEVKWQAGTGIEVHSSKAPQVWSWQSGTLGNSCSNEATQAMVRWESPPSARTPGGPVPRLSELVEVAHLRPVPPTETHIAETDMPPKGSLLEVDCGDASGYKCAVLVGKPKIFFGQLQDLDSMIRIISSGTEVAAS